MGFFDMMGSTCYPTNNSMTRMQKRKMEKAFNNAKKAVIREVAEVSPEIGEKMEKADNALESVGNVCDALFSHNQTHDSGCPFETPLEHYLDNTGEFSKGDHIYVYRIGYSHHGIYDGAGNVYEYQDGIVKINDLDTFSKGSQVYVYDEKAIYSPNEIVARAQSRLGENEYNLIYNNCQNFATWCRCGIENE